MVIRFSGRPPIKARVPLSYNVTINKVCDFSDHCAILHKSLLYSPTTHSGHTRVFVIIYRTRIIYYNNVGTRIKNTLFLRNTKTPYLNRLNKKRIGCLLIVIYTRYFCCKINVLYRARNTLL